MTRTNEKRTIELVKVIHYTFVNMRITTCICQTKKVPLIKFDMIDFYVVIFIFGKVISWNRLFTSLVSLKPCLVLIIHSNIYMYVVPFISIASIVTCCKISKWFETQFRSREWIFSSHLVNSLIIVSESYLLFILLCSTHNCKRLNR